MKKATFYKTMTDGKHKKATGYIETMTTPSGEKISIGYEKCLDGSGWAATHIKTGCYLCGARTRKDCVEIVKDRCLKTLERKEVKQQIHKLEIKMIDFLATVNA